MKKFVLPIVLSLFTLTSVFANSINSNESPQPEKVVYKINTFCKLIQMGDYDAVKSLIDAGEDVNKRSNGLTPLMFAARHNKAKIAELLIDNGAKIKAKTDKGLTALDYAKRSKAVDAAKVLKEALKK